MPRLRDCRHPPSQGKVARYARGGDYHTLIWRKLEELLDWLRRECPGIKGRAIADTAPLLERDFARLAGLGWIGKNTMLIDRRLGSFTFLGALLIDAELEYDAAADADHCGTCTLCLDAVPDPSLRGPVPARRRPMHQLLDHRAPRDARRSDAAELDGWVFGCDVCQDVCPWNRKAPAGPSGRARPHARSGPTPTCSIGYRATPSEWKAMLKGTALARASDRAWCATPPSCSEPGGCRSGAASGRRGSMTSMRIRGTGLGGVGAGPDCDRAGPGSTRKASRRSRAAHAATQSCPP